MGERRRKQQVEPLIRRWQTPHDVADVGDEAQVEHPVGFVEHQHLDRAQVVDVLLVEVDEATRRADQDVDAGFELTPLFFIIDSAEGEAQRETGVLPEDLGVPVDLHRELPRRRDDQRTRRAAAACWRNLAAQQRGVERNEKGGGLARPGLRLAGHVHSGQRPGQRLRLDRRAAFETCVGDAARERFREMKVGERNVREMRV